MHVMYIFVRLRTAYALYMYTYASPHVHQEVQVRSNAYQVQYA